MKYYMSHNFFFFERYLACVSKSPVLNDFVTKMFLFFLILFQSFIHLNHAVIHISVWLLGYNDAHRIESSAELLSSYSSSLNPSSFLIMGRANSDTLRFFSLLWAFAIDINHFRYSHHYLEDRILGKKNGCSLLAQGHLCGNQ